MVVLPGAIYIYEIKQDYNLLSIFPQITCVYWILLNQYLLFSLVKFQFALTKFLDYFTHAFYDLKLNI